MLKKVLLTGASGAVGYQTFRELLNRKDCYQVRIFCLDNRYERKLFKPYLKQAEVVWGDIRNFPEVLQAVDGVDTVLHLAGIIPPLADYYPQLAREVNVVGTRNLVTAMHRQETPGEIIFTSSISVYGDRLSHPYIQVGDPLCPSEGDIYAQTKIEAEKIIQSSGIRWSIFRLCGILVDRLQVQPLMFHMPLETALEWCHVEDTAFALAEAIAHESIFGRVFNLGGGERCRIKARDFLDRMLPMWGLEAGVIPDFAFATRNFHSGYYLDSMALNQILKYQRRTLQDYFESMRKRISPLQRFLVGRVPRFIVRYWLMKMSEPLKAVRDGNQTLIQRFYGSHEAFERVFKQGALSLRS